MEKERAELRLAQEQRRLTRLENREQYYEKGDRAKRTHELCNIGGTVESLAPVFKGLPKQEMYELLETVFSLPEVQHTLRNFASLNGQIVSVPVEPDNPLRAAEMPLEDDYGMIDVVINNGRRGEEQEKAAENTEKKPSIMDRLVEAQKECADRKPSEKTEHHKKSPELGEI